jgi:hypothetical protein
MPDPREPFFQERWVACKFVDASSSQAGNVQIQPFGAMQYTGVEVTDDGTAVIEVSKVIDAQTEKICFNSGRILKPGEYGICTMTGPMVAKYKSGSSSSQAVAAGDYLGTEVGSEELVKRGGGAFLVIGVLDADRELALITVPAGIVLYQFRLTTAMISGQFSSVWNADAEVWVAGGTGTTVDATVHDYTGIFSTLQAAAVGYCILQLGSYIVIQANCLFSEFTDPPPAI